MSVPFTNLEQKTGRTMPEWLDTVSSTGLTKHTDIVAWLTSEHGLTHGFANGIAQTFRDRGAEEVGSLAAAVQTVRPQP
jgi:hypothetical protein